MGSGLRGLFALLGASALATGLLADPAVAAEDAEAVERRLEELRGEIESIQQRVRIDRRARDEEMENLAETEREISRLGRRLRETREALDEKNEELESLRGREQALQEDLAGEEQELGNQLRSAHRMGGRSRLQLILSEDDPQRFARLLAYHSYLTGARVEAIEQVTVRLRELADVRMEIEESQAALESLEADQRDALEDREVARERRAEEVAVIEDRITDSEVRLLELEQSAAELEDLLEELTQALADIPDDMETPDFADLRGQIDLPVPGRVAAGFGDNRGGDLDWNGWLIRAEEGTEVKAVAHGRVVFSDWLRGYGLVLIIDHGQGYLTLYAHNESLYQEVGDWVRPGQAIATVGSTGGEREPGLYFELRSDGQPVDPAGWMDH